MKVSSLLAALSRYGVICNGKWDHEAEWCTLLFIPTVIGRRWINTATGLSTTKIYVNRDMAGPLNRALNNVLVRGLLNELKTFDGVYRIRDVRGCPGQVSTHSYALAIDINAAENPLGAPSKLSPAFVKCFTDEGFSWGGKFHRLDAQHFSYAWE
jgi:hypothetical protein